MAKYQKPERSSEQKIIDAIEQDVGTSEEAIAKAVSALATTKDKQTLSDLTDNEVKLLTALQTIAKEFQDDVLGGIVENYPRWRVSAKRLGRKEIKDIAASQRQLEVEKAKGWRKLFGLGGG